MKRKISLLLAAILLLSCVFTGCGNNAEESYAKKLEDKYVVRDGSSSYVLVLPENAKTYEQMAAEEFTLNLENATGVTIETVTESAVPSGAKYISLGCTSQFLSAFSQEDLAEVDGTYSSYLIASRDDNIYICGSDDYEGSGVLYGVYDLMYDLFGYTYYHDTEVYVEKTDTVNLWSYDKHIRHASFDMRTHSTAYIYGKEQHNIRLRYINFSRGIEWDHITIGHSQVNIFLSPNEEDPETGKRMGDVHPEWFYDPTVMTDTKNNNQLCWTAGGSAEGLEQMQTIIANKMLEFVMMNQEATFFMLGQMDTEFVCQCASCRTAVTEWGGTACGLQINFVNGVIEKTEALIAQNCPGREVLYAIYAYKPTLGAPAKLNEAGEYVPYSDKVIPHEKMRVFFAPVRLNFGFSYDAPQNADAYAHLQGWDALCDKDQLMVYTYDLNIRQYFTNFFNLGTIASHLQDYEEAGVNYVLSQGVSDGNAPCFDELRAYCISRLMWDTSLNFGDLAKDFVEHYYKDAAPAMWELYQMIVDQNAYFLAIEDPGSGTADGINYTTTCYPKAFVEKMDRQIDLALEALTPLEQSDPEQHAVLKARVMKEALSNIYLKMVLYKDFYSESEIAQMQDIWITYTQYWDLRAGGEGFALPDIFG